MGIMLWYIQQTSILIILSVFPNQRKPLGVVGRHVCHQGSIMVGDVVVY